MYKSLIKKKLKRKNKKLSKKKKNQTQITEMAEVHHQAKAQILHLVEVVELPQHQNLLDSKTRQQKKMYKKLLKQQKLQVKNQYQKISRKNLNQVNKIKKNQQK